MTDLTFHPLRRPEADVESWAVERWRSGETNRLKRTRITSCWRTADGLLVLFRENGYWNAAGCEYSPEWKAMSAQDQEALSCRAEWVGSCRTLAELIDRLSRNGAVVGMSVAPWRNVGTDVGGTRLYVSACGRFALWAKTGRYRLWLQGGSLVLADPALASEPMFPLAQVAESSWWQQLCAQGAAGPFSGLADATRQLDAALKAQPTLASGSEREQTLARATELLAAA
jgi:hypothetical protein